LSQIHMSSPIYIFTSWHFNFDSRNRRTRLRVEPFLTFDQHPRDGESAWNWLFGARNLYAKHVSLSSGEYSEC
jgi:hypothetical protein